MRILDFLNFSDNLLEGSIGSEAIRNKWYPDLDKRTFYKLVNFDPTSVRKENFSKPGKHVKWLIKMYKDLVLKLDEDFEFEKYFDGNLNFYLFLFSTGWYKSKVEKNRISGNPESIENDIFKFKSIIDFESHMSRIREEYLKETENAKFDTVFSDDKIDILIPINYTASAEISKNTEWCTRYYITYLIHSKVSLMFRVLPKLQGYDKMKLTWHKKKSSDEEIWTVSSSRYPEFYGKGDPFKIDPKTGKENLESVLSNDYFNSSKPQERIKEIRKTLSLLSKEAKESISEYYEKYGKS